MEKTGHRDELQHNARLLTTLLDVSNLVSSTMELKPLLEAILDKLGNIIEYRNAKIFTIIGNQAKILAHRSRLTPEEEMTYSMPMDLMPAIMKFSLEKKPMVIADLFAADELSASFRNAMDRYMDTVFDGSHCWMSLPMVSKDKVIGILTLDHSKAGFYKEHHIELGTAFANQAAIEFENVTLYNETVKKADEIKTMFNIQQAITSRLELDAVLRLIAGEAGRLTHSHSTAVFLVEGGDLVLSVLSDINHNGLIGRRLPAYKSAIGKSLLQNESIILDHPKMLLQPDRELLNAIGMHSCLCVPLVAGSRPIGVIAAFSKHAGEFDSEDERIFNMFAPSAVIGVENARLYQEERYRHQEDEQRRHVAEGLRDILAALNSNRSLEEILDFIIKEAARLLHTDAAALFRLNREQNSLTLEAVCGLPHLEPNNLTVNVGIGFLGKAFTERKPVVKTNRAEMESILNQIPGADMHTQWLTDNCSGMIAVPLICKNEVYGGIVLYIKKNENHQQHIVSKDDIGLAMTFADQAALAIDNTRLRRQAEEMAVAAERNRLARDLHDAVTQTLFSASLIAEVLPRIWERSREDGLKRLEELRQLTRGALAEMRTLLFELRPATLVEAPLEELLRQLCEAITGRARVPVTLNISGRVKLPTEVKIAFYRIAQEALNNIAKHSGARKAIIELKANEDEQLGIIVAGISITDDGRGFDPAKVTSEHFGVGIMRERAETIGAKLTVRSIAGDGTSIEVEWVGSKQP
jgi:signal transduction histidine kinase